MVCVSYAGEVLPPVIIKDGKTPRCLYAINAVNPNVVGIYSDSGWMTAEAAKQWLSMTIIKKKNDLRQERGCLIWDVYASHIDDDVKQLLAANNIDVIYIPANKTGKLQPLDTHVFAPIKQVYKKHYYDTVCDDDDDDDDDEGKNKVTIKQADCVSIYNELFLTLRKEFITRAFKESIIDRALKVVPAANDPQPAPPPKKITKTEQQQVQNVMESLINRVVNGVDDHHVDDDDGDDGDDDESEENRSNNRRHQEPQYGDEEPDDNVDVDEENFERFVASASTRHPRAAHTGAVARRIQQHEIETACKRRRK
jgi:hypothetical protein